ncbi:MAG: hypothetical protein KatS3mg126_0174 [Lysobacteraceae bacterium]|nr:MAG: hypothetical protein KatS3mg126_0174 [Xanthomonadaceae bacterium]
MEGLVELPAQGRGGAEGVEVDPCGAFGIDRDPLDAAPEFQSPALGEGLLFEHEQAEVAGDRGRHEGFLADRAEIAPTELQTPGAAPAGQGAMHRLDAALDAVVLEAGADRIAFQLEVLVAAVRQLEADRVVVGEGGEQRTAGFEAALLEVDAHRTVLLLLLGLLRAHARARGCRRGCRGR